MRNVSCLRVARGAVVRSCTRDTVACGGPVWSTPRDWLRGSVTPARFGTVASSTSRVAAMRAGRLVSITRASSHSARRLTGVIVGNDSPRDSQREASSSNTLPPYDPVKATLNAAKSENHAEREADPNPPAPQAPASEEAVGDESEAWCQRGLREKDKGNSTEALLWIRKSADAGYVLAQLVLAVAYQKGECGLESDHFKAFDWFLKAAQQGNAEAQYCVGMALRKDEAPKKNPKAAVEWYRKAAKQDHAGALFEMAVNYMNETGGLKYDTEKGIVCTRKAAKLGNHQAQFNLGVMLYHGKGGVPLDEAKAVYWIRKSADQGYDLAQTLLGLLYYHGEASLLKTPVSQRSGFTRLQIKVGALRRRK